MTPEDFDYFKGRVTRFISGSNRRIKFGSSVAPKYSKLSGISPKRSIPASVLETIQKKPPSDVDDTIETTQRGITSLGKITLDLEQTRNNLEKIIEIIADDYKSTQETNKKEIDEYRKRVANRGRIFGKRELGDRKSDVLGTVKKYVGSFFSGAGGAIRALSMFNLLQGLLTGDPSKIVGPLLGIGLTYIPSIIGSVIGGAVGGVGTALTGRLFGGGARAAAGMAEAAAPAAAGASRLGALGKLGGRAALVGGGIALVNSLFNKPQDQPQQRLEQLTEQQKGLTQPQNLVPLPQDDLKRFERLNKKFEDALDFLMKKQKESEMQPQGRRSSGGGSGGAPASPTLPPPMGELTSDVPQNVTSTGQTVDVAGGISYYGTPQDGFGYEEGKKTTASGAPFNPNDLTAAHRTLPFGTLLRVTNRDNGRSVVVRVTDRGPFYGNRSLDLSTGAMRALGGIGSGVLNNATIEVVKSSSTSPATPAIPPATPRARPAAPRSVSALPSTPNITVATVPVNTSASTQASATSAGNDVVPEISTTYSENFLTLYSRLNYQIV